jgi:hypothetical protein
MSTMTNVRPEQAYGLPPGTTIHTGSATNPTFYISDEGSILACRGSEGYAPDSVAGYSATVPDEPLFERRRMTYDEYRQWVCVVARGFQRAHSVNREPVVRLLRHLDCWFEGTAEPGTWVHQQDPDLLPPEGRVLTVGYRGDWRHFGVFTHRWGWLHGGLTAVNMARVDGPVATPTEEDAERIRALKVEIWDKGVEAKRSQDWCGAFERAVGTLRIDRNVVRITAPVAEATEATPTQTSRAGEMLRTAAQAALPLGAIVQYADLGEESWNWCVRNGNTANPAGTSHLLGTNRGVWGSNMRLVFNPDEGPMFIPLGDEPQILLDALPVGSVLSTNTGDGARETSIGGIGVLRKWPSGGWHASLDRVALPTEQVVREWRNSHIIQIPGVPGWEPTVSVEHSEF